MEVWRPITNFEDAYEVSNYGNVRSITRVGYQRNRWGEQSKYVYQGRLLKKRVQKNGYETVDLRMNGKHERYAVHRLVAEQFIEKPYGKGYINHLDCNKINNRADNLEWCTQSENIQYAYDKGTKMPPHMKKVGQFDDGWNLVAIYESTADADRATGIARQNIQKVCWGKRDHAGRYRWKYIGQ
jgi:hypothetical protein